MIAPLWRSGIWRIGIEVGAWLVACAWCLRVFGATRNMPKMPNLAEPAWDKSPVALPHLTVVVPARNEAANIAATLDSLLAQDYPNLQILAVDDRSTDDTGAILHAYAQRHRERLSVIHLSDLPNGWLGKTHAMHVAVESSDSAYLLFTDADVVFAPEILRRALAYAEQENAAHVVVAPTPLLHSLGEGTMIGFLQMLGLWAVRPWRVADPKAKRDAIGVGAFNMVRRDALESIGGLEPQRLVVIEDGILGMRIKAAGLPQRLVFAPGMVRVHWARGARGIVQVMTKNLFSGLNFQPLFLFGLCAGITVLFIAPLVGLLWLPTLVPSLLAVVCVALGYRAMQRMTSIDARYAWTYPAGAVAFIWAMFRSMFATWAHRGVEWRGTRYPLRELRKHNSPFQWRRARGISKGWTGKSRGRS